MANDVKPRKRMVVEEVVSETAPVTDVPTEEIKEKVEELQDITQEIGQSVEKSEDVQEQLAEAVEKVTPSSEVPQTEFTKDRPNSGPSPLLIIIPGVLLLGALLGGVYFYEKGVNQSTATPTPMPTIDSSVSIPTSAPSASPSAKLNLAKYPINVENGSGIPGTAGSAKAILTKAGFKVSASGNADNYNYTDTIIKTKSDVPAEYITKLTTALSGVYSVAKAQVLTAPSTDEVVVIIGSSKSQ